MDILCNQIIKDGNTLENCINESLLGKITRIVPTRFLKRFHWDKVRELHIMGNTASICNNKFLSGVYTDESEEWVLCLNMEDTEAIYYLSRCSKALEVLDIRFTELSELNVQRLSGLTTLSLNHNSKLERILQLEQVKHLYSLDLGYTGIKELRLSQRLEELQTLWADNTGLKTAEFLRMMPGLITVNFDSTPLTSLPSLEHMPALNFLRLSYTEISTLENVAFPPGLQRLYLDGTPLHELPDSIGKLRHLDVLDLSKVELHKLPLWLPDLGLDFYRDWGDGIRLADTTITGISMSIFDQPREMIVQWFADQKMENQDSPPKSKGRRGVPLGTFTFGCRPVVAINSKLKTLLNTAMDGGTFRAPESWYCDPRESYMSWPCGEAISSFGRIHSFEQRIHYRGMRDFPEAWTGDLSIPEKSIWYGTWDPSDYYEPYDRYLLDFTRPIGWSEAAKPLREMKIVFLGDGEAGKSHTIARLLKDGEQDVNFPGVSTPGILIDDKIYNIDGKNIKVHFWDFGGQEILHSMHRMFLTERTLYVVVLNVREGNQDERARYWLHNLRSFANGAPVLLALNKMDMNRNASVNESDLRAMYPGLKEVVKISAREDSKKEFEDKFIVSLHRQIGAFEYLESPFLPAWSRLKDELHNMSVSYIRGNVFRHFCNKCGVKGSDDVRRGLLNWFGDLGVSFCYSDSRELEDYVVLRPDWITNAIYILLFNKIREITNGLVSHETIYEMLQSPDNERTVPGATYAECEVEYVLNVFRKFRLSFRVEDGVEFLPMLCDANSTSAAEEYASDPAVLELRMEYEYLPNNVLHRLMVERRRDLDLQNVWLTGTRFVYGETGLSAVVKSEGNLLRILVRSEGDDMPQRYLEMLKADIERINEDMGLNVSGAEVAYKQDGLVEYYDYEDLLLAQEFGDTYIRSKLQKKRIPLNNILLQSDYPMDENRRKLLESITRISRMLQDNKMYWDCSENERTTYIRDMLQLKEYVVMDQHLTGASGTGISVGEVDLEIRLKPDIHWAAFEALNIRGKGKSALAAWDEHLGRLLGSYNAVGRSFLIHMGYVEATREKYGEICAAFREHLRFYSPVGFELLRWSIREVSLDVMEERQGRFVQMIQCVYDCGGAPMTVYHFFVRVGE